MLLKQYILILAHMHHRQQGDAWERVLASDVRYRFVLDISTMAHQHWCASYLFLNGQDDEWYPGKGYAK
ncbi:hypothetical protein D3C76_1385790 [compost metagenome]